VQFQASTLLLIRKAEQLCLVILTFEFIIYLFLEGALEKQKIVYMMTGDNEGKLRVSSPLETNKSNYVTFDLCGLDVGLENPVFASLEAAYSDGDEPGDAQTQKQVVFYEVDLGLNHVLRKLSVAVDFRASRIFPGIGSDISA